MSEFTHGIKKPLAVVAAALASVALAPKFIDVSEFTANKMIDGVEYIANGGDKTIDVGVACDEGESLRVLTADTGWSGYLTIGCKDSKGNYTAPRRLELPGIDDGSPITPNFLLSTRVNNYGAFYWTLKSHIYYDPETETPQSKTIGYSADSIKEVKIEKLAP